MTYLVKVHCENCGKESKVNIEEGTLVKDSTCPICKCKALRRAE